MVEPGFTRMGPSTFNCDVCWENVHPDGRGKHYRDNHPELWSGGVLSEVFPDG